MSLMGETRWPVVAEGLSDLIHILAISKLQIFSNGLHLQCLLQQVLIQNRCPVAILTYTIFLHLVMPNTYRLLFVVW